MALPGMLAEVTQSRVAAHLVKRDPEIIDADIPEQLPIFEDVVRGAAVQVVLVVGEDPIPGRVRNMAVEAVALEAASQIEYASYPEQQSTGDTGRGHYLHQRFLELLAELRRIVEDNGGVVPDDDQVIPVASAPRPRARFPEARRYPDPVIIRGNPYL